MITEKQLVDLIAIREKNIENMKRKYYDEAECDRINLDRDIRYETQLLEWSYQMLHINT